MYECGTLVILQAIRAAKLRQFADFDAVLQKQEKERLKKLTDDSDHGVGGQFLYGRALLRSASRLSRAVIEDTLAGRTPLQRSGAAHVAQLGVQLRRLMRDTSELPRCTCWTPTSSWRRVAFITRQHRSRLLELAARHA